LSYPAHIFKRLNFELALEGDKVVPRVGLVLEVERLLPDTLLTVRRREDAADALDRRGAAVTRHDPAPDDALDLVVADASHVLAVDGGMAGIVTEDPEGVA